MTVKHTVKSTSFRTLKPGNPGFTMEDGMVVANRAGFEISITCPYEYRMVIDECIRNGWLKPVATVYDHELVWEHLRK